MSTSIKTREKLLSDMLSLRARFARERHALPSRCWEELSDSYRSDILLYCRLIGYECGTLLEFHHLYSVADIMDKIILDLCPSVLGQGPVIYE